MKKITLLRLTQDLSSPQRGVMMYKGEPRYMTFELPWKDNQPNVSCIPEGGYTCKKTTNRRLNDGPVIPETFEVMNVPGRSGILFHSGNTAQDTRGCILLGLRFGSLRVLKKTMSKNGMLYYDGENVSYNNEKAVLSSKEAMNLFLALLALDDEFELEIKRALV